MMVEQTAIVEKNYLTELYKDIYIKSAVDIDATINIISWMENLSYGVNTINHNGLISETSYLPGKPPIKLLAEFKQFYTTCANRPNLKDILELRDSLYRFQSLY